VAVSVETAEQLEGLKRAGRLVAQTLRALRGAVTPGVSTAELDWRAARMLTAAGARSGPILTYGYPGCICVSVGDEVVHGIPGRRRLREGDLVTLDVAVELDGYHADAAVTVAVGQVKPGHNRLMVATRASLEAGIRAAQPGVTLREVGAAIERTARGFGYRVFRDLAGHGIGRRMHEDPIVFNWPAPEATTTLTAGLVFTIEPMLTAGATGLVLASDGWTVRSADRSVCAHEEHTIMVADRGPIVLTA
jgi:methionyl aminopeptidase